MVQSLGISVGNANSYVAACQGGGIEILLNEFSNRSTPSMVAFTDKARCIGTEASSNFFMNMKNTVYDLMVLLGKPFKEVDASRYPFKIEEGSGGQVIVVVRHLGEERKFTITQVLAMLMTKLRGIAGDSLDCVLSCPQFYNDSQKTALIQAGLIAGLNPLQVITDMSAVILNYAYYRTTKEDTHKFIAFINFGQSNLQSVVAWLTPKEDVVRILAAESAPVGGNDFDRRLAEHFIKTCNLTLNQKSYLKLVSACEKVKRLLSANANEIPINVESLISEDKDFSARIDRATFEEMSQDLLNEVQDCFKRTFENAKANFEKFMNDTVEAAKATEVARAAEAQKTAQLSKEADDAKAIRLVAEAKAAEEAKARAEKKAAEDVTDQAKEANGDVPMSESTENNEQEQTQDKAVNNNNAKSANNKETAMEVESEELTKARNDENKAVQAVKASRASEKSMASQISRLNRLSQLKFELNAIEMVGGSSRVPAIRQRIQSVFNLAPSTTLNTDEAVARGCALHCATLHPGMKVKREVRILNAEPFSKPSGLTCDKDLRRVELELITQDRRYMTRTEARNSLEEYIYVERSKLQEGDQFLEKLSSELDWLFTDEGEEAPEDVYNKKLSQLKQASEARLVADKKPAENESDGQQPETNNVEKK